MALLGVDRRTSDGHEPEVALPEIEAAREEKQVPPELSDEDLFLASLGQMDSRFRDEIPLQGEEESAAPRRMRQLRQGKLSPEDRLDLHGLTRQEARDKVRFFLEDGVFHGRKTVLIITGRGKGSAEGPVLREFIEGYLSREARAWVVEWGRAPARYGGEGALGGVPQGTAQPLIAKQTCIKKAGAIAAPAFCVSFTRIGFLLPGSWFFTRRSFGFWLLLSVRSRLSCRRFFTRSASADRLLRGFGGGRIVGCRCRVRGGIVG
ncbi:MAG: Smr/MutS family protein [Syntrophotaleaceae bacterium]